MILKEPPNHTATPNYHSRASGNPVLTRGIWIPACAGMTIYSRCVDTYALRGERSEGGEAGGDEGRGPRMRQQWSAIQVTAKVPGFRRYASSSRLRQEGKRDGAVPNIDKVIYRTQH